MRFDLNDGAGTEPIARGGTGLVGNHPEPVPTYTGQITPPIHAPDTNPGTQTPPQFFGLSAQDTSGGGSSSGGGGSGSGGGDQSTINRLIDLAAAEFGGGNSIMGSGGGVVALPTSVDTATTNGSGLSAKAVVFLLIALGSLGYYFYKKHSKKEAA